MPSARVSAATAVNPGFLASMRRAKRVSFHRVFIVSPLRLSPVARRVRIGLLARLISAASSRHCGTWVRSHCDVSVSESSKSEAV